MEKERKGEKDGNVIKDLYDLEQIHKTHLHRETHQKVVIKSECLRAQ